MTRRLAYRNFALRLLSEAAAGGSLLFLLSRILAPPLISAHDTALLILGVAALAACPVVLVLLIFRLWRTWSVLRRSLEAEGPGPARLTVH